MGAVECAHEQDLLDALDSNRWPARCEAGLRRHVAACSSCSDLVQVAAPLKDDGDHLWSTTRVPSPGTVWWRAQMRARREAAREAARPITVAQAVGASLAIIATIALLWVAAPWLTSLKLPLPALPSLDLELIRAIEVPESFDLGRWRWVVGAAVCWLVLAPLAIYFAVVED